MSLADLGRRAVACKHWRWMPGMLAIVGTTSYRVLTKPAEVATAVKHEDDGSVTPSAFQVVKGMPDLSDPATLGCLLHLVREAWGVERAVVWWNEHDQGWVADVRPRNFVFVRDSEAHALVAALEAAP